MMTPAAPRLQGLAAAVFFAALGFRLPVSSLANAADWPSCALAGLAVSALALCLAAASVAPRRPRLACWLPLAIFSASLALSVPCAAVGWSAFVRGLHWATVLTLGAAAFVLSESPRLRRLITVFVLGFLVMFAVHAVVQRYVVLPELERRFDEEVRRIAVSDRMRESILKRVLLREAYGVFVLPNALCAALCAGLFMFAAAARRAWRRGASQAAGLLALGGVVLAFGAFMSGALGGWLATALVATLAALVFLLRRRAAARWTPPAAFVALVAAGALVTLAFPPERLPTSAEVRARYWRSAVDMFAAHPLGVGLGNFRHFYPRFQDMRAETVRDPHNLLVSLSCEAGLQTAVALVAFVLLLWLVWWSAFVGGADPPSRPEPPAEARPESRAFARAALGVAGGMILAALLPLTSDLLSEWLTALVALGVVAGVAAAAWRARVDVPQWGTMAALGVLFFSALIDFNGQETNYMALAAVLAATVLPRGVARMRSGAIWATAAAALGVTAACGFAWLLPRDAEARIARGWLAEAAHSTEAAHKKELLGKILKTMRRTVESVPSDPNKRRIMCEAGLMVAREAPGRATLAATRRLLEGLLRADRRSWWARARLAELALADGDGATAADRSAEAVSLAPGLPALRLLYAEALQAAGRRSEALREVDAALEMDKIVFANMRLNEGQRRAAAELRSRLGRPEK